MIYWQLFRHLFIYLYEFWVPSGLRQSGWGAGRILMLRVLGSGLRV